VAPTCPWRVPFWVESTQPNALAPASTPPFYGPQLHPGITGTVSGVGIITKLQVIDCNNPASAPLALPAQGSGGMVPRKRQQRRSSLCDGLAGLDEHRGHHAFVNDRPRVKLDGLRLGQFDHDLLELKRLAFAPYPLQAPAPSSNTCRETALGRAPTVRATLL